MSIFYSRKDARGGFSAGVAKKGPLKGGFGGVIEEEINGG